MDKHEERLHAMGTNMRAVPKSKSQQAQQDADRKFHSANEEVRTHPHGYSWTTTDIQWI